MILKNKVGVIYGATGSVESTIKKPAHSGQVFLFLRILSSTSSETIHPY